MARNLEKDAVEMAAKRENILKAGFRLFSERGIEPITMNDVAREAGVGIATLYRYYSTKPELVMAVSTAGWSKYVQANDEWKNSPWLKLATGAQRYEFFLNSFIALFRTNTDMLRFNQFFNIYVQAEKMDADALNPYHRMIDAMRDRFHQVYEKGINDGTIRKDTEEHEMFTASLHIMLATATRYAIGLVYQPDGGSEDERELEILKEMFMKRYTTV